MEIIQENVEYARIQCCMCSVEFSAGLTGSNMCVSCLSSKESILKGITREGVLNFCRHCKRYLGNIWMNMGRESKELLSLCLKKIRGIKELKIVEAGFIWTEEHCRRVKVKLIVSKEIQDNVYVQDSFVVEFREHYQQCLDCKKEYTPHTWVASIQLRQRSGMKKTLLFLEQIILKLGAHEKCVNIKQVEDGLDFFFKTKSQGQLLLDFIQCQVPVRVRNSKQLISADLNNNLYNYKYVWVLDIPKINRYDLIIIDEKMRKELGLSGRYLICSKVSRFIHLLDNSGVNGRKVELDSEQYFNYEEKGHIIEYIPFRGNCTEFMVIDVDYDEHKPKGKPNQTDMSTLSRSFLSLKKSAHVDVQRTTDWKPFSIRSHLGEVLRTGNIVLGFDLTKITTLNDYQDGSNKQQNDVMLVMRQKNQKKFQNRIYKLKRMKMIDEAEQAQDTKEKEKKNKNTKKLLQKDKAEEQDMEDLMQEIDRDPDLRKKVNLYKNQENIQKIKQQRIDKYKTKETLLEKIESLKQQQLQQKGRSILKVKNTKQQKIVNNNNKQESDQEWVDCNTDEENEINDVKLAELIDDLNLSDNEQETAKLITEQEQLLTENQIQVDSFINQMANLTIHNK